MLSKRSLISALCLVAFFSFGVLQAQTGSPRLNDKDLERLMRNANDDAKVFRKSFEKALEKSTIRKTSREKEAKQLAKRFEQNTEGMAKAFDRNKKADAQLPVVFQTANQLEQLMRETGLSGQVTSDWQKVRTELDQIAQQFGYTPPAY